ncbi:DNA/RNA non-specific endonuclease [Pedobacter aquatilis]|uniref:DNA/RNA non-specific endonuclease n=1 Tax=Pedobacter aquatilis TaxID=351343 RepID=UPI00292EC8E7|nr:DNA/RNA non-specific endonuclease [Pedobacter aquatilis]
MATPKLGYNPDFLKQPLPFPELDLSDCVPLLDGKGHEIKYTHFSLFQHRVRKLPLLAAVNISGEAYSAASRTGGDVWKYCEQIDEKYQIDNSFYSKDLNTFDRGHIVRRVDPCWGDEQTSTQAEKDTFNWANCSPQHTDLNQRSGIWYQLEQHIMEKGVKDKIADISVFAGPVLDKRDLNFIKPYKNNPIQIPSVFWKVIVWKKSNGKLYAVGFIMSQWEFIKDKMINGAKMEQAILKPKKKLEDDYFETLKFSDHKTYQVSIKEIEKATGISFSWSGVSFPFKKAKAQAITAEPVKKVESYASVFNVRLSPARNKESEITQTQIKALEKAGEGYRLKRFELKNITL